MYKRFKKINTEKVECYLFCPSCGSDNTDSLDSVTEKGGFILQVKLICCNCGKEFIIEYAARAMYIEE